MNEESFLIEKINVYRKRLETLFFIEDVTLDTYLDEERMETYCFYNGKRYEIQGNIYHPYIAIELED